MLHNPNHTFALTRLSKCICRGQLRVSLYIHKHMEERSHQHEVKVKTSQTVQRKTLDVNPKAIMHLNTIQLKTSQHSHTHTRTHILKCIPTSRRHSYSRFKNSCRRRLRALTSLIQPPDCL